jgi:hypothetical protein
MSHTSCLQVLLCSTVRDTSSSGADGIFELRFECENFRMGASRSRCHGDDAKLMNDQIWVTSTCHIQGPALG